MNWYKIAQEQYNLEQDNVEQPSPSESVSPTLLKPPKRPTKEMKSLQSMENLPNIVIERGIPIDMKHNVVLENIDEIKKWWKEHYAKMTEDEWLGIIKKINFKTRYANTLALINFILENMGYKKVRKPNITNTQSSYDYIKTRSKKPKSSKFSESQLIGMLFRDNIEDIKSAINNGVDVNAKFFGQTRLHRAVNTQELNIVKLLLEQPNIHVNEFDDNELAPLSYAYKQGKHMTPIGKEIIQLLKDKGAINKEQFREYMGEPYTIPELDQIENRNNWYDKFQNR